MRKESSEVKSHDQDHIATWASYPSLSNPESLSFSILGVLESRQIKGRMNKRMNE